MHIHVSRLYIEPTICIYANKYNDIRTNIIHKNHALYSTTARDTHENSASRTLVKEEKESPKKKESPKEKESPKFCSPVLLLLY